MTCCAPTQKGCRQPLRRRRAMPCCSRSTRLAPSQNLLRQSACPRQAITASGCKVTQACPCYLTGQVNVTEKTHTKHETLSGKSNACLCRFAAAAACIKLRHLLSMHLMSDQEYRPFGIAAAADLLVKKFFKMQFWQLFGNTVKYTQFTCQLNPSLPSVQWCLICFCRKQGGE